MDCFQSGMSSALVNTFLTFVSRFHRVQASAIVGLLLCLASNAFAVEVMVNWQRNPETYVTGYRVYYGATGSAVRVMVNANNATSLSISNLELGKSYQFLVTAVDQLNRESLQSAIVTLALDPRTDPRLGGKDTDGDGITDGEEMARGLNPLRADSDGDGVADGKEDSDGTDPLNPRNFVSAAAGVLCLDWAGVYRGSKTWLELTNRSNNTVDFRLSLTSESGTKRTLSSQRLAANATTNLELSSLYSLVPSGFGRICAEQIGGTGAIDGRVLTVTQKGKSKIVVQRGRRKKDNFKMELGTSNDFAPAIAGKQSVSVNFLLPGTSNFASGKVANYVVLNNTGNTDVVGTLRLRNLQGIVALESRLLIPAGLMVRLPNSMTSKIVQGLAEWTPDVATASLRLSNARMASDWRDKVRTDADGAGRIEGASANVREFLIPMDVRSPLGTLEIWNSSASAQTATAELLDINGRVVKQTVLTLPALGAQFVDIAALGRTNATFLVRVRLNANEGSLAGVLVHNGGSLRTGINGLRVFSGQARLATELRGSVSSVGGQRSEVWIANSSPLVQSVTLTFIDARGKAIGRAQTFNIVPAGTGRLAVSTLLGSNRAASVIINGTNLNLSAWVIRRNEGNELLTSMALR